MGGCKHRVLAPGDARQFSQQWRLPCFPVADVHSLISFARLIMVGFHFLHCFEEDLTSEHARPLLQEGCMTGAGVGSLSLSWCQGPNLLY